MILNDIAYGNTFKEDGPAKYLDFGPDNYAGVTFNGTTERISIAWMNNWEYANQLVRDTWNGSMTAARKLQIQNGEQKNRFRHLNTFQEIRVLIFDW